jgi:isopenicillin-N epimerase
VFGRALRPLFLLAGDAAFLNHGSFGACPKEVLAEQGRVRLTMETEPDVFFKKDVMPEAGDTALRRAAAKIAAFVNAPAECVAFVENATAGVQAALRSIDLRAGDRILVTSHTYNAMRLMVEERCAETGATPIVAQIPLPATADAIVDAITSVVHPGAGRGPIIKVAIIDHITSPTALVFPLDRIIPMLRANGTHVIVDGAHAIGQIPLDLGALQPDWYVSNLHKWLFAPKGTAFFYASKDVAPKTRPNVVSHFIDMGFPASFDYTGTRDNSGWLAAPAALRFFEDLEPASVWAYQKRLLAKADDVMTSLGAQALAPIAMNAAMRSFVLPQSRPVVQADADSLVETMWNDHRIQVWSKAFDGKLLLRVSAQVYVDEEDLRRLADALQRNGWPGR